MHKHRHKIWYYLVKSLSNCLNWFIEGQIIVIINGKVLLDEVVPFFRNSDKIRPTSLQGKKCLGRLSVILYKKKSTIYLGKLTLGKGREAGFWYQYQGDITNLNVFGWHFKATKMIYNNIYILRSITKDEMKRLTGSEDCFELPVDSLYLPWTMMKWNFFGEFREYNIDKSDLCPENSVFVFFPSK